MARANVIGNMREQIVIQQRTATQDDYGEPVESWTTYATVWAKIEGNRRAADLEQFIQATGKERQRSQYIATIYHDGSVGVSTHRAAWNGKYYDILQVGDPDGRRQWSELYIREIV